MKKLFSLLLAFAAPFFIQVQEFHTVISEDLNGDSQKELIRLVNLTPDGHFRLEIADAFYEGKMSDEVDGLIIVDIDTRDRYKEVAVHTPGASSDDEYFLFWYDGRRIIEAGRLSRWPQFAGNGIVYVDDWKGFWKKREKFILDPRIRKLKKIPQQYYYVGVKVKVNKEFSVVISPDSGQLLASLRPQSEIEILLCKEEDDYLADFYLIRTASGLLGWARYGDFWEKVDGLPLAD